MTNATLMGKPDAANLHVRFDEEEVSSAKPRRWSRPCKTALKAGLILSPLLIAGSAFCTDYYYLFPDKKVAGCDSCTTNDLAHVHLWGDANPYAHQSLDMENGTFMWRLGGDSTVYTCSSDFLVYRLNLSQNQYANLNGVLDAGKDRKVLAKVMSVGNGGGRANLTVKSGTLGVDRTSTGLGGVSLFFGDGTGAGAGGSRLTLDGPDAVFQTSYSSTSKIGVGHASFLRVCNGALLSGPFTLDNPTVSSNIAAENGVLIEGLGSRYLLDAEAGPDLVIGSNLGGATMVVSNQASAVVSKASDVYLGYSTSVYPGTGDRLVVTDRSTLTTASGVSIYSGSNHVFEVSGGSTATIGGKVYVGYTKSANVKPLNNIFRVTGEGTSVDIAGAAYIGYADCTGQRMEVSDKAVVNCQGSLVIGRYSSDSVVEVKSGGVLRVPDNKSFNVGSEGAIPGCKLLIASGGVVTNLPSSEAAPRMYLGNYGAYAASIVVDGGTLYQPNRELETGAHANSHSTSFVIKNGGTARFKNIFACNRSTNNTFTVEHSSLRSNFLWFQTDGGSESTFNLTGCDSRLNLGELSFRKTGVTWNVTLSGELPFEETPVVNAYNFAALGETSLNVTLDEQSFPIGSRGSFTLVHTTGMDISDDTLANLKTRLPSRVKLTRSADKRNLNVSIGSGLGMSVIIK